MSLKYLLLLCFFLGGLWVLVANSEVVAEYVTRYQQERDLRAKKAAYNKQYRHIDWNDGADWHLKMRIPRKFITKVYKRHAKQPFEMIVMSASYPEFKTGKENKNSITPNMLHIHLDEKHVDPPGYAKNIRYSAERDRERKRFYLYPNNWGLDHYKPITCLEYNKNMPEEFLRQSEPHRDELTPKDCWVTFGREIFIPKTDTYAIRYYCTSLAQIPEGWGGCTAYTDYKEWSLHYVMRRSMIPEWKAVHEGVLQFLNKFLIAEQPN